MWGKLLHEFSEKRTTILPKRKYTYKITNSIEVQIYQQMEHQPYLPRWFDAGCVANTQMRRKTAFLVS